MSGLVSIIIPSYNSKRFIKEAIGAVLSQTYKNWEMIIVNDLSSDNSAKYIKNLIKNDGRIKLLVLDKNVGASEARNKALEIAKGQNIAKKYNAIGKSGKRALQEQYNWEIEEKNFFKIYKEVLE